ncbi:MAG: LacI family DNA-binding transcriptional regulator [Bryobacteraceae bacterium]
MLQSAGLRAASLNTVRDVARAAGVSAATVSRVLNGNPRVDGKIRERVLEVIRETKFRPNANARRLVRGSSGQICFVLSNRDLTHSFHSRILKGVENYCRQQRHQVVFTVFNYAPEAALPNDDLPRIIWEGGGVEGVVIAGTNYPVLTRYVERLGIPYVLFGNNLVRNSAMPRRNAVCFDEEGGARQATEFLIQLGHRRVAFFGNLARPWYCRRYEGYRAAMAAQKLQPVLVGRDEPAGFELGRWSVPELIRRYSRTTAIVAQDDETACGALDVLRRLGILVPEEMSLIGYDDIAEVQYLNPPLTTVQVPKEKIGWTLAEQLFRRIEGKSLPAIRLETQLLIRGSCARVKA